jgi:hypothetical protein
MIADQWTMIYNEEEKFSAAVTKSKTLQAPSTPILMYKHI